MTTHEVRNGNGVNETTPRHPAADAPSFRDAEALPTQVPMDGTEETSPRAGESLACTGETLHREGKTLRRTGRTFHRDGKTLRRTGETLDRAGEALHRTGRTLQRPRERSGRDVLDAEFAYDHVLEQTFPASDPPPPP
ncbi:MAG: hypothetical protein GX162_12185 [Firmicutes bacterium]|jgi:hypothetical protein|nr:hypothetical protein [Bacillota bacterium]